MVDAGRATRIGRLLRQAGGRELVATLLRGEVALGADRTVLLAELESLRGSFRAQGDEAPEDALDELMDRLAGFCHPSQRI